MNSKYNRFIVVDSYGRGFSWLHDVTRVYYGNKPIRAFKEAIRYGVECGWECDLHFFDLGTNKAISINGGVSVADLLDFYHRYESI